MIVVYYLLCLKYCVIAGCVWGLRLHPGLGQTYRTYHAVGFNCNGLMDNYAVIAVM